MDRFREHLAFVAVAETGAFNAAARRLAISPPAVTRLVTALEERIGARLFVRTTRQVALTDAGRRLLTDSVRVLTELDEAEASSAGVHQSPRGMLRITAPVLFGQRYVAPILRDYLDAHPQVTASVFFVDRVVDLIDEGLDVAVRIGDLPDSSLTATRVGAVRRLVVASPAYLSANGVPAEPRDLSDHRIINTPGLYPTARWSFEAGDTRHSVQLAPRLDANTVTAAVDAALAGWGIARALSYQVADHLESGDLVELLPDHDDRSMPLHLVHSEGRRAPAKVRTFIDFATNRLRTDPRLTRSHSPLAQE